jgi:hypothetical protein
VKQWKKDDEWVGYAACGETDSHPPSKDHTLPPERGEEDADKPVADPARVRSICAGCPVRPECIRWSLGEDQPTDVWVAGVYIPVGTRRANRARDRLKAMLPNEIEKRGDF